MLAHVKFGCQLPLEAGDFEQVIEVAKQCEELGYDSVWAYDHLSPFWTRSGRVLECWTVLAAVAARTSRIRIGSLVTNVNVRSPSLLAKMSSTIDNISGGRLIVGLGTGDRLSRDELLSYGYNFASTDERVERLKESILILKAMWTEEEPRFEGKYYRISKAINSPKPRQKPHPPIWIGGKHFKILDLVAEMAEGWNYWNVSKEELAHRSNYLSKKCAEIGRNSNHIVKSWSGTVSHLFRDVRNRDKKTESIVAELRSQSDDETEYFIAHLGPRAEAETYRLFADAVGRLE